jgi:hypothetical protein
LEPYQSKTRAGNLLHLYFILWQTACFGNGICANRLGIRDGTWTEYSSEAPVKHLLLDSSGTLWVAISGAGLARLDGFSWTYFRTDNSCIANNIVDWDTEVHPGIFLDWESALPTNSGGAVARFDGKK